jgi:hypothetical protein
MLEYICVRVLEGEGKGHVQKENLGNPLLIVVVKFLVDATLVNGKYLFPEGYVCMYT